jgi:hypothetical protein
MIIAHRTNARCSDYASSHVFRTGSAALARNISIEATFEAGGADFSGIEFPESGWSAYRKSF